MDSNEDEIGNLQGIISRLDYLKYLDEKVLSKYDIMTVSKELGMTNYKKINTKAQTTDPDSGFHYYNKLIAL